MSKKREDSLGGESDSVDLGSVIAEFPNNDDNPTQVPVKKLSEIFDTCVNKACEGENGMKVYLRVRPTNKPESTIVVESETSIVTNAPDTSKRALYTKTESRNYVRK